jgi:hypothetical protein
MYVGIGFIETARTRALPLSGVCHYWCEDEVPVSYPSLDGERHHKAESFFIFVNFNYSDFGLRTKPLSVHSGAPTPCPG